MLCCFVFICYYYFSDLIKDKSSLEDILASKLDAYEDLSKENNGNQEKMSTQQSQQSGPNFLFKDKIIILIIHVEMLIQNDIRGNILFFPNCKFKLIML